MHFLGGRSAQIGAPLSTLVITVYSATETAKKVIKSDVREIREKKQKRTDPETRGISQDVRAPEDTELSGGARDERFSGPVGMTASRAFPHGASQESAGVGNFLSGEPASARGALYESRRGSRVGRADGASDGVSAKTSRRNFSSPRFATLLFLGCCFFFLRRGGGKSRSPSFLTPCFPLFLGTAAPLGAVRERTAQSQSLASGKGERRELPLVEPGFTSRSVASSEASRGCRS